MKFLISTLFAASATLITIEAYATDWVEDTDGEYAPNEYRVIDTNGAVTRRPCPYTCAMRQIPKNACKEWHSVTDTNECYVQDLRIGRDDAMPRNTFDESARAQARYKKQ